MGEVAEVTKVLKLMQEMMAAQQKELNSLRENAQKTASGNEASTNRGPTVDSLEKQIRLFTYNPDEGWIFDAWWARHQDLFDTVKLEDDEMSRLLLRHVDDAVDRQFRDHIRPKTLGELKFSEVKEVMNKLFGDKKTLFEKRLEMFNLKMSKVHIDDLREFATRVNRVVEDANVTDLTPNKIKTMIFLAGIDLPRHTGAMFQIINGMKKEENATLERLLEIADSYREAQLDSQTVTGQNRAQVNAVRQHPGRKKEKHRRDRSVSSNPDENECERCGRDHEDERCPFVNAICHNCGKTGHIRVMCRDKNNGKIPRFNKITSEQSGNSRGEFDVSMKVNGIDVEMSVDSGSDLTFISEQTWRLVGSPRARRTDVTPVCTNGSIFRVKGKCDVNLEMYGNITFGEVYITEEMNVLGKDFMQFFFTLMPKRPQAQLGNSISQIEVTEVEEDHSGTGMVEDQTRNHSIRSIEVTEIEEVPLSGTGPVIDESRNHSTRGVEVTEKENALLSESGLWYDQDDLSSSTRNLERSGSASSETRSSLKDDSPHSDEERSGEKAYEAVRLLIEQIRQYLAQFKNAQFSEILCFGVLEGADDDGHTHFPC